jgi:hypothetical protein
LQNRLDNPLIKNGAKVRYSKSVHDGFWNFKKFLLCTTIPATWNCGDCLLFVVPDADEVARLGEG